jgi:predicted enzyme related to lactoylglutathione lyase
MASANNGRFVWYEHLTKDSKAAIAFYREVIGWQTQPFGEGGEYTMWAGSQGPLGGVIDLPEQAAKHRGMLENPWGPRGNQSRLPQGKGPRFARSPS